MNDAQTYLRLDTAYCRHLGELRWSATDDALVYPDGGTFAFNEEIALFLEGFASGRPLIHFVFMLHILDLVRSTRRTLTSELFRLHRAFAVGGQSLRNAGAFCAVACQGVPDVPGTIDVRNVCDRVRNPAMPIRWFVSMFHDTFDPVEQAPLEPAAFERHFLDAVEAYSDEELATWFRHGRGPVKQTGEAIARQLPAPPPRTLAGVLEALLQRPRLSGARPFLAQMVSALSLPPRRLAHQEMPVGGYADVATRGQPDQILPSQFALDEQDFFRRFAEQELLYFRREEPQARTERELVVLLDQGVRTWGDVRLVLSAAALALAKQADRSRIPLFLAATSGQGEPVDPLQVDEETLGRLVDASDLTPNPGLALERILEQPALGARDVVLLTHPRNLQEPDVSAAARRVTAGTRLFTVALDGEGEVDLGEVRRGVPVRIRHFRVDFAPGSRRPPAEAVRTPNVPGGWRGDVEPIGFPFRFGINTPIARDHFDFDQEGEWLLTASRDGILHAWKTDGSTMEVLPRGMWEGAPLTVVEAVLGVAGGFVVAGRMRDMLVTVHYDFVKRTCTSYSHGRPPGASWHWEYSREHHALIGSVTTGGFRLVTLDLATGAGCSQMSQGKDSRAKNALMAAQLLKLPSRRLWILNTLDRAGGSRSSPSLYLDPGKGRVTVFSSTLPWPAFTPQADGRPVLMGCLALEAQCCGDTLALVVGRLGAKGSRVLHLFRGPEGIPLCDFPLYPLHGHYALSADGRYLARQTGECQLQVRNVADGGGLVFWTRKGGFSQQAQLLLGSQGMILQSGKTNAYVIRWDRDKLELRHEQGKVQDLLQVADGEPATRAGLPECVKYDPQRFVLGAQAGVIAVLDRFGQVAIFDRKQALICMFFAFAGQVAAWMPDGTSLGPASLTGQPPTPGAAEKIGRALRAASERGRSGT
jgi:hypothetical protein